ncbi:HAD-IIIC family phosphatase [Actinokineospora inagensis]|uniref:HAD-IIIC family phosphatase n=1 Tax=Actinokineospora inagensis TaxID=103730 RepID=UPI00040ACD4E|nr:HAD-IIIC family phosphatase [Actinokineospora inagensis]
MTTTTDPTARQRLLDLHRAGALAANYPAVRRLLAEVDAEDLARCGQLLARLDPADVLVAHPEQPVLTVAITGHGTVEPLVPPLTAELARHGLLLRPHVADFDSYVFDLSDPDSALYRAEPDIVLCLLDPRVVFDEVPTPWGPDDVERVFAEKLALIEGLLTRFTATTSATLVLNTVPLPRDRGAQLLDYRSRGRLGVVWREANARLLTLAQQRSNLVVIDLDPLIAEGPAAVDPRLSVYAGAHLSAELLTGYAREVGHLARQLTGRTKKVLALDLDGTLWGGILAEDGADGITVAGGYAGAAFAAFRELVKQIGSQGVLLAVVSKNDAEPVSAVLREHPDLGLTEDDFVRVVANWLPKSDNLRALADALNLGVDSFVFVDDSTFECGLVRHELPEVAVVQVGTDPATHLGALLRDGWFDTRALTATDRIRAATYRAELARRDLLDSFATLDDYLRQLDLEVRFAAATDAEVPRVSQMSLRTNQFNLTTQRWQENDVRAALADPARQVLTIRVRDRFGDSGIVGVVSYRRDGAVGHIDNFVLSCRVFSRGVEQACLSALLGHARESGVEAVQGVYRPTAKNHGVREFYPRHGFEPVDGPDPTYRHDLTRIAPPPDHVRLVLGDPVDPARAEGTPA